MGACDAVVVVVLRDDGETEPGVRHDVGDRIPITVRITRSPARTASITWRVR